MKSLALASLLSVAAMASAPTAADAGGRHGFRYHGHHFGYYHGHHDRHCEWRRVYRHGHYRWIRFCW